MKLVRQARVAFADIPPEERERLARLGAVLFMTGSLTAIPAGLLLEPPPKAYEHLISAFGFVSGAVLYRLDWKRLPSSWLHVFPVLGTLVVIAGMTVFSVVFSFFIVLGGMFVAISVGDASVFSAYMAFFRSRSSRATCTRSSKDRRSNTACSRVRRLPWASESGAPGILLVTSRRRD